MLVLQSLAHPWARKSNNETELEMPATISPASAMLRLLLSCISRLPKVAAAWHWHHQSLVQTQTNGLSQVVGPAYPRPPHRPYSGTMVPVGIGAVTVV